MTSKIPAPNRVDKFISTTYCDDIRQEVHNKLSFVGIYQGKLLVSSFPARIPRLCVVVHLFCPKEQQFESVKIGIYRNDILFNEVNVTPPDSGWKDTGPNRYLSMVFPFVYENIELSGPATLKVRATFDDKEILPAPSLEINEAASVPPSPAPSALPAE